MNISFNTLPESNAASLEECFPSYKPTVPNFLWKFKLSLFALAKFGKVNLVHYCILQLKWKKDYTGRYG